MTVHEGYGITDRVELDNKILGFSDLGPCDASINSTYKEAFDYAFNNKGIRNIGITGPYGCGKSSLWRGYSKKYNKKCISVCIGTFFYGDKSDKDYSSKINGIEKQLINQILVQVSEEKIPLSIYLLKENKSEKDILYLVNSVMAVLAGIGINIIFNSEYLAKLIGLAMGLIGLRNLIYGYIKKREVKINKLKISNVIAEIEDDRSNESILDKEIREIIYILSNAEEDIIVFEDLDRVGDPSILIKLREINYLLNCYNKKRGKPIKKFIYMISDEIFLGKERTKFFDYIIPVIPVVSGVNSSVRLANELGKFAHHFNIDLLEIISYYVDDMRLLKNIVNEYKIYLSKYEMDKLMLRYDVLFALVTLKNLMPFHFIELSKNQGVIFESIKNKNKSIEVSEHITSRQAEFLNNLIKSKYINDNYHYYIDYFYEGNISSNDMNFILSLDNGFAVNLLYKLDNKYLVYSSLKEEDFRNAALLNADIVSVMIEFNEKGRIKELMDRFKFKDDLDPAFIIVLEACNPMILQELSSILKDDIKRVKILIDSFEKYMRPSNIYKLIVMIRYFYVYSHDEINNNECIYELKEYVERYKQYFLDRCLANPQEFYINMDKVGVKFEHLRENCVNHLVASFLINAKCYVKDMNNIIFLVEKILKKKSVYSSLYNVIFNDNRFNTMREYIEEDFEKFLEDYINYDIEPKEFRNSKEDTLKILNSGISEETKEEFRKYNKTIVDEE